MILSAQIPDPSPDFSIVEANWGWLLLAVLVAGAVVAVIVTMWMRRQDSRQRIGQLEKAPKSDAREKTTS